MTAIGTQILGVHTIPSSCKTVPPGGIQGFFPVCMRLSNSPCIFVVYIHLGTGAVRSKEPKLTWNFRRSFRGELPCVGSGKAPTGDVL